MFKRRQNKMQGGLGELNGKLIDPTRLDWSLFESLEAPRPVVGDV